MQTDSRNISGTLRWMLVLLLAAGGTVLAEDNTSVLITNVVNNGGTNYIVGVSGTNNSLVITSGGRLTNVFSGYVGYTNGANQNSATVDGTGSGWFNLFNLRVGQFGASNSLTIRNGGIVSNSNGCIGYTNTAIGNVVTVDGSGSRWVNTNQLIVGLAGWYNSLTITNGGSVTAGTTVTVGSGAAASNNVVTLTGLGSKLVASANLIVGGSGRSNALCVDNRGAVFSSSAIIGSNSTASANCVLVSGANSVWSNSNALTVGYAGSANVLTITNGGAVFSATAVIGSTNAASGNGVLVTGTNSLWRNNGTLTIGYFGSSNTLTIHNGGVVSNTLGYVGSNTGGNFNRITVDGAGSRWLNTSNLAVGVSGWGNSLMITNGGAVTAVRSNSIGGSVGASNNTVTVTGAGSGLAVAGSLVVGLYGKSNSLAIRDGGGVTSIQGCIGFYAPATNNNVVVDGAGSRWLNESNLIVGLASWGSSLMVTNDGAVFSSSVVVGANVTASNNLLSVSGGTLAATNAAATGLLDVRRGALAFNGGNIVADSFHVTNRAFSIFQFNAGTLTTLAGAQIVVPSNSTFIVGATVGQTAAWIVNGGSNSVAQVGGGGNTLLGGVAGATGVLTVNGGTLDLNDGHLNVGAVGNGEFNFNAGTVRLHSLTIGPNGAYNDTGLGQLVLTGGGLSINSTGSATVISSPLGGDMNLLTSGSSVLVLTGSNAYTGGTIVTNGATIVVGNDLALGSGTVALFDGTTLGTLGDHTISNLITVTGDPTFDSSGGNLTISSNITGSGDVVIIGTNTVTFTANNSYTGPTVVSNSATLRLGNGGVTGSPGTGAVTNNGALIFNVSGGLTVANNISGTGNLIQDTGLTWLLGVNDYTGTTTINPGGALSIGSGSSLSGTLGAGVVLNNGILYFGRADTNVVANNIGGTGTVWQWNAGRTILTGSNSYGATIINPGGALQIGNGSVNGSLGTGSVTDNGELSFNRGDTVLVVNAISGSGSLTHLGAGLLVLSNANTYAGGTWIANGGTLSVKHGNALGLGNVNLLSGTLQADPLVIAIGGSYTQAVGGTLQLAVGGTAPGASDQLAIAGYASLTGTLRVVQFDGFLPHFTDQVTLLVASNGVSGAFNALDYQIPSSPLLEAVVEYDPDSVTLAWTQLPFLPYAVTPNQQAVARNLDGALSDPRLTDLINYLDYLPGGTNGLPAVFDLIAPEELSALFTLAFAGMDARGHSFLSRVNELRAGSHGFSAARLSLFDSGGPGQTLQAVPVQPVPCADALLSPATDNPWGLYLEGAGEFVNVRSDANASGYHLRGGGFTIGLDRRLGDKLVVGLTLGYADTRANLANNGNIDVDSGRASIYAAWFNQGFHLEGMLGGGYNSYDTRRLGLGGNATGKTDGTDFTGLIGGGYDWQKGIWVFGPQLTLQYKRVDIDGFSESGSMSPLHIESQSEDAMHSRLGVHVGCRAKAGKVIVSPDVSLSWQHEYFNGGVALDSRFANGAGNVFTVRGPGIGRDSVVIGAGVWVQWTPTVGTYLNYNTELGRDGYEPHNVQAGVCFGF